VCLLPLSLAGEEMGGSDFDRPFWAAAVSLNDVVKPTRIVTFVAPSANGVPAGRPAARWRAVAHARACRAERSAAHYPSTSSAVAQPAAARDDLAAVRHAVEVMTDRRTYGALAPGILGCSASPGLLACPQTPTPAAADWAPGQAPRCACSSARERRLPTSRPGPHPAREGALAADPGGDPVRSEAQLLTQRFPSFKPTAVTRSRPPAPHRRGGRLDRSAEWRQQQRVLKEAGKSRRG